MNLPLFRLAHISDLHFSKLTWSPSQFFSKRWIGNLNLLLARKHAFDASRLTALIPFFRERNVDAVVITGDLSSTSHTTEFALAKEFLTALQRENFQVFTLPGNHDQYTKGAFKSQLFYQFFDPSYSSASSVNLKEDGLTIAPLGHKWCLIGLDTAVATSLLSANGYFSPQLEDKLERALQEVPRDHQVILINHFPLFTNESARKSLLRKEALKALIERFPNIKLYLHGHTHRQCIADVRSSNLPIILDSGSVAQKKGGTWNLIDIKRDGCDIEVFKNQSTDGSPLWEPISKSSFKW